ncbi:hypothetical protein RMQ97_08815 [Maricaulis sp. D1M11]|uniref:hypothetical protein n=1 Tax=Maricaulis sp. D1M11 TaxID=3076117 RepID=UPI0039B43EF5
MSKPIYALSSIARPLEPQYPTNLAMLILLPIIAVVFGGLSVALNGSGLLDAALDGVWMMLAGFVVWAMGREIDPDRNATAFIALPVFLIAASLGQDHALLTAAATLMAMRVVNRCVGNPLRAGDRFLVTALAAGSVFVDGMWAMGLVVAIALALDTLFDRKQTLNLVFAMISLSFSAWHLIEVEGDFAALTLDRVMALDTTQMAVTGALLALGLVFVLILPALKSVGDATGQPLSRPRVRGGGVILLLAAAASTLAPVQANGTVWLEVSALYAVIVGFVLGRFWPQRG